jgi:hypothetical protein
MRKIILLYCFVVIGALSFAGYQATAAEKKEGKDKKVDSGLIGSRWRLTYDNPKFGKRQHDLLFLENGKLINQSSHETSRENDTWEADGNKIVIKFNNGFAAYTGELSNDKHMAGTATSKTGGEWNWEAERIPNKENVTKK